MASKQIVLSVAPISWKLFNQKIKVKFFTYSKLIVLCIRLFLSKITVLFLYFHNYCLLQKLWLNYRICYRLRSHVRLLRRRRRRPRRLLRPQLLIRFPLPTAKQNHNILICSNVIILLVEITHPCHQQQKLFCKQHFLLPFLPPVIVLKKIK